MTRHRLFLPFAAIGLAACASPVVHYHTLVPPPSSPAVAAQLSVPFLIEVLPIGVPPQLDRPQLVVRQGENSALVLDNERWLGPLDDEIRMALSAQLVRQGFQDVSGLSRLDEKPVIKLRLQVRRMDARPGDFVKIETDWSLSTGSGGKTDRLLCRSQFVQAAPGGYAEMTLAQQRLFAQLADRIAATARLWDAGRRKNQEQETLCMP